ncbi:hypothetical protein Tco_0144251 [Tanacetum coccineum]
MGIKFSGSFLGAEFQSFKNIFDNNIDHLKEQLDNEELHKYDSKTCLAVLKKQFEPFFDLKSSLSSSYQYQSKLALQKKIFQEYAHYTPQIPGDNSDAKREIQELKENCSKKFQELKKVVLVLNPRVLFTNENEFAFEGRCFKKYTLHDIKSTKDMLVRYLNAIEKEIDARAHHEEELQECMTTGKEDSSPSSTNELEKESGENICENAKCEFQTKFVELEKVLTQQTKDFDDVKLELSYRTAKFEAYFEKLEKMKVVLERQLARKVDDSKAEKYQFLKEIIHLRIQLENLKGKHVETKIDNSSILGKPSLLNSERYQLLKRIAF